MALQAALTFLSEARRDEALARSLAELDETASLESLAAVARRSGFDFTAAELERAHALDWRMRRARYSPD